MLSSFKKFLSFILIICSFVSASMLFAPVTGTAKTDYTYVYVTLDDGTKWIYEYDDDGRLIDIIPDV